MYKRRTKKSSAVGSFSTNLSNGDNTKEENKHRAKEDFVKEPTSPELFDEETAKKDTSSAKKMSYLQEVTRFSGMMIHKKDFANQLGRCSYD